MCTLSWTPLPQGYALAMNRDELRTRAPALLPTRIERGGVPVLVPVDGEAGGTWISVNGLGHSLALLNRFHDTPHDPDGAFISRGLLVLELAGLEGPGAVDRAIGSLPLIRFRPFTLASLAVGSIPALFEWNGRELSRNLAAAPGLIRASSGSDQEGAERARGALFREAVEQEGELTPEMLAALHRTHLPEKGPVSICMHREEAITVSCSLITVSDRLVSIRYITGSPCESSEFFDSSLPR